MHKTTPRVWHSLALWLALVPIEAEGEELVECASSTTASDVVAGRDLRGLRVAITGGDTGLGLQTALALSGAGADVTIMPHDRARGEQALELIRATTGRTPTLLLVDLLSARSTRRAATALLATSPRLDRLINNAAVVETTRPALTPSGLDGLLQINYVSPFLLTELLMPALRRAHAGRVIDVSSGLHLFACAFDAAPANCTSLTELARRARFDRLAAGTAASRPTVGGLPFNSSAYGVSKWLQVFHAAELSAREAARGSAVRAVALEPGVVDTPLLAHVHPETVSRIFCGGALPPECPTTTDVGAATATALAAASELPQRAEGGYFGHRHCTLEPSGRTSMIAAEGAEATARYQRELWALSRTWAGLPDERHEHHEIEQGAKRGAEHDAGQVEPTTGRSSSSSEPRDRRTDAMDAPHLTVLAAAAAVCALLVHSRRRRATSGRATSAHAAILRGAHPAHPSLELR